jgi:hypothetical protein
MYWQFMSKYALAMIAGFCVMYFVGSAGVVNPSMSVSELKREDAKISTVNMQVAHDKKDPQWVAGQSHVYVPLVELGTVVECGKLIEMQTVRQSHDATLEPLTGTFTDEGTVRFLVAYSDPTYLAEGVLYREMPLSTVLRSTLFDERLDGVMVDPMLAEIATAKGLIGRRFNVIEIINALGYLESLDLRLPGSSFQIALDAYNKGTMYAAVHVAQQVLQREGVTLEERKVAELVKLKSFLSLRFPGSVMLAYSELVSFKKRYGLSSSLETLLRDLAQNSANIGKSIEH